MDVKPSSAQLEHTTILQSAAGSPYSAVSQVEQETVEQDDDSNEDYGKDRRDFSVDEGSH